MKIESADLQQIASRGLFLHERIALNEAFSSASEAENPSSVERRVQAWKKAGAAGHEDAFHRLLQNDELDDPDYTLLFEESLRLKPEAFPDWVNRGEALLESYSKTAELTFDELEASLPFLNSDTPVAFEHLLGPLVCFFARQVEAKCPKLLNWVSHSAWNEYQHTFLVTLAMIGSETLGQEFSIFRAVRKTMQGKSPGRQPGSREIYAAFVDHQRRGKLVKTLTRYPLLLRYWISTGYQFVRNAVTFFHHLETDFADIRDELNQGKSPGKVSKLTPGISDRHDGGKTSVRVEFEDGLRTIYKAKSLDTEVGYHRLLDWLNQQGLSTPLNGYHVIDKQGHGWVEFVDVQACRNKEEVKTYFTRGGMLLALFYAIEGSDLHNENLIAHGAHPVIVDLETILQSRPRSLEERGPGQALIQANQFFYWDSVFRTALLPRWEIGPEGQSYDISGLGGVQEHTTSFVQKQWKQINSDDMQLTRQTLSTSPNQNVVRLNGTIQLPSDHREELLQGFREMYALLLEKREELLAPGGPLHRLSRCPVRFIQRNTRIYVTLLRKLALPKNLTFGPDASIVVESLARPFLSLDAPHPYWPLVKVERENCFHLDIPRFMANPDSADLEISAEKTLPAFFEEPAWEQVQKRFRTLSEADCDLQQAFIRSSFASTPSQSLEPPPTDINPTAWENVDPQAWEDEALELAEKACHAAIRSSGNEVSWLTLSYFAEAQRWQVQPMAARLYDGLCGPLVFLAAAERVSGGSPEFRATLEGTVRSISSFLQDAYAARYLFEAGTGAGLGASSLIYALVVAGALLEDRDTLNLAEKCAFWVGEDQCEADQRNDLLGGNAGAVSAFLALHSVRSSGTWMDRALACGDLLLGQRVKTDSGYHTWLTLENKPLLGFSHGAAGIIMALSQLGEQSGESRYIEAAEEALAYENSFFDEEKGNWPDLRYRQTKDGYHFTNRWCHGAPGIGLGRLYTPLPGLVEQDILRALDCTKSQPLTPLDHLCCGNLGRAQALQVGGLRTGDTSLVLSAQKLTQQVYSRARNQGGYGLGLAPGLDIFSFHQGLAGIGYHFLWMNHLNTLPCILAWETTP